MAEEERGRDNSWISLAKQFLTPWIICLASRCCCRESQVSASCVSCVTFTSPMWGCWHFYHCWMQLMDLPCWWIEHHRCFLCLGGGDQGAKAIWDLVVRLQGLWQQWPFSNTVGQEQIIISGLPQCTKSLSSMRHTVTDSLLSGTIARARACGISFYNGVRRPESWGDGASAGRKSKQTGGEVWSREIRQRVQDRIGWVPVCTISLLCQLEMGSGRVKMAFRRCYWVEKGQVSTIPR